MHLHISVLYVHMCVCVCVLMYVWTLVNCWKQKWNGDKGKMAISINSSSASEGDARDLKKSTHLSAAGGKEWEGRDRDRRREREREREGEGESAVVDIAVLVLLLLLSSIFTLVASYQMAAAQLTFLTFVYTHHGWFCCSCRCCCCFCCYCGWSVYYMCTICCCCFRILYASTAALPLWLFALRSLRFILNIYTNLHSGANGHTTWIEKKKPKKNCKTKNNMFLKSPNNK